MVKLHDSRQRSPVYVKHTHQGQGAMAMDELIRFIEGLIVPNGRHRGQPMVVLPFQRRFLRGAFSQPDDAALTLARGGGKTTLNAAVLTAALIGPLAQPNAESVLVASSFEQSLIGFRLILSFLRPWLEKDSRRYRVQDSVNRASITDRNTGASVRVLGSDPKRLHGLQANLLMLDEVAQWPSNQVDAMVAALETSRGKIPDSRLLWIGTRPEGGAHPFAKALEGGVGYSQVHAARPDDPPFRRKTWLRANPGLAHFPDLERVIRIEAQNAKVDPSRLAQFKALRLNMGVSDVPQSLLLPADTWARAEGEALPVGPFIVGIDLGGSYAQSAAAAYWPLTGRLDAVAVFPAIPDLTERGLFDGVGPLYTECARRGELLVAGQRVAHIPTLLEQVLSRWGTPAAVVADRYRIVELRPHLEAVSFPTSTELVERGMGYRDGAEDVRAFCRAALDGELTPVKSLLLRSSMAEARTVSDPAGNRKLAKGSEGGRRERARDDTVAAAILAVSVGQRGQRNQSTKPTHAVVG